MPGRPANLDYGRQRASVLAGGAGGACLDIFSLVYHFSSFSFYLKDDPIQTEILSQRAVKPKQPTNHKGIRCWIRRRFLNLLPK